MWLCYSLVCFFFQAEDGIRYGTVTGVQTCALPILSPLGSEAAPHDTDSSASDLQVTADGAARSQCLPLAGLFRRSTHGRRPFRLPYHRLEIGRASCRERV